MFLTECFPNADGDPKDIGVQLLGWFGGQASTFQGYRRFQPFQFPVLGGETLRRSEMWH